MHGGSPRVATWPRQPEALTNLPYDLSILNKTFGRRRNWLLGAKDTLKRLASRNPMRSGPYPRFGAPGGDTRYRGFEHLHFRFPVSGCATPADSAYIVTGDKDLHRLGQFRDIRIIKVAEMLERSSRPELAQPLTHSKRSNRAAGVRSATPGLSGSL